MKKNLSILQWAAKAEQLRKMFKLDPAMMAAEIKYNYYSSSESKEVVYTLYFSHLIKSSHSHGQDWKKVYDEMKGKLLKHNSTVVI
jgi:hypothetical protein